MKTCFKCKIDKEKERFTKRKSAKDGLHTYCKECVSKIMKIYSSKDEVKKRSKIWREQNSEKVKIHAKKNYEKHKVKRLEQHKKYYKKNKEEIKEKQRDYYKKNKEEIKKYLKEKFSFQERKLKYKKDYQIRVKNSDEKIKARNNLRYAVYSGKIIRPDKCQICFNSGRVQGHHEDYSKQLQVIWVCQKCHKNIHFNRN